MNITNPFKKKEPSKWFFEADPNPVSNTIRIRIYRHGAPYSAAEMTITDECKDPEQEKQRFINAVKLLYPYERE